MLHQYSCVSINKSLLKTQVFTILKVDCVATLRVDANDALELPQIFTIQDTSGG